MSSNRAKNGTLVLLTNFVPPYRTPVLQCLSRKVAKFAIIVDVPMEADRQWEPNWSGLDVRQQRTLTFRRRGVGNGKESRSAAYFHIPLGILPQLFKIRPDTIITSEFGARTVQAVLYRITHPQCRLSLWATLSKHTEENRGRLRAIIRRQIVRSVDTFMVNGQSGAEYLTEIGAGRSRIHVVNQVTPGAAATNRMPGTLKRDRIRYLVVGQLIARKGIHELFTTVRAHASELQHIEIVIAGSGPQEAELRALAGETSVPIHFTGELTSDRLAVEYQRATYLLFPTLSDEWGLVVNEAFAYGLPVLGSKYSEAVCELVTPGQNGWIFDPKDTESVMEAIRSSSGTTRYTAMTENSRETVRALTPEICASTILDALART